MVSYISQNTFQQPLNDFVKYKALTFNLYPVAIFSPIQKGVYVNYYYDYDYYVTVQFGSMNINTKAAAAN